MDDRLHVYEQTVILDLVLSNLKSKYPFQLNEKAKYTQHQISLYQANYCHVDSPPTREQPSVEGGSSNIVSIALFDL